MPNYICTTCGAQHAEGEQPPLVCAVCQNDRQYLKVTGQQWTTHDKLRLTHRSSIRLEEPGLFMYSYSNYVPLSAVVVDQIVRAVEPFEYERVYGAFWDTVIERDGKAAVARSAERYRQAIQGDAK